MIASPSLLTDGTPFPTWAWLTCPYLAESAAASESAGDVARWAERAAADPEAAAALLAADAALREARAVELGGEDACGDVGVAGQRDPLGVKCVHAWVALSLMGIDNPIGTALLARAGDSCDDERCASMEQELGLDTT